MKKIDILIGLLVTLFILIASVFLAGCSSSAGASSHAVTPAMLDAMAAAANEYAQANPNADHNTPHECRVAPAGVCFNGDSYVVTCSIPSRPGLFGTVTIEDGVVVNFGTVRMGSLKDLQTALKSMGCK